MPDRLGPFLRVQHDMRALELCRVILERGYRKRIGRHEAVPARGVAGADAVDLHLHHLRLARVIGQDAQDGCRGRTHRKDPVPHRIDLGHGKLRMIFSSSSATISAAGRPGRVMLA